nr:MAG TPA: Prohead core protein protease [Caudoviricetes sp.]
MHKIRESNTAADTESLGEGKYRIRIIVPGVGSSGVYTAENLAESVHLFKAGTEMFIDHPTESEEWDRPERSIRDYAGVFLEDATVGDDGALYAVCKVFSSVNDIIKDKWEHIGVSINAWCSTPINEDRIVPVFDGVRSVDFVTLPGAGGAIVDLLESNRIKTTISNKEDVMDSELKDRFDSLETAVEDIMRIVQGFEKDKKPEDKPEDKGDNRKNEAAAMEAGEKIAESGLPAVAAERVRKAVLDGVDVEDAIEAEREYIKGAVVKEAAPQKDETNETSLKESFKKIGWA